MLGNMENEPILAMKLSMKPSKEKQRLRRRALSRRICLGQLVWDCSQKEPRAVTGLIHAHLPILGRPFMLWIKSSNNIQKMIFGANKFECSDSVKRVLPRSKNHNAARIACVTRELGFHSARAKKWT